MDLCRSGIFRCGGRARYPAILAGGLPCQRRAGDGRFPHARLCRRKRGRGARPRRRAQRLHQCLPPSRRAPARRAFGMRQEAGLPLSCLDLRSRWPPDRRTDARNLRHRRFRTWPRGAGTGGLARLRLRAAGGQRAIGGRDDGAVRGRGRALSLRGYARLRPGDAAPAHRKLEERRRQLFGRPAHRGRPSRPQAADGQWLWRRGQRACRQDVGPDRRSGLRQRVRACLSALPAAGAAFAARAAATVDLFQALAQSSPSTSIPTRSISCSGCRSRRRRR